MARFRQFDQAVQGYGDIMGLTGEKGNGPLKVEIAVTDIATGMFADSALPRRENRAETTH